MPRKKSEAADGVNRGAILFGRWLAREGLSQSQAAERLDIAKSYVGILVNSRATPSLVVAARIQWASEGAIPCDSWVLPAAS